MWLFESSGYAVGEGSFKSTAIKVVGDARSPLLLMDDSVVTDYYSQVSGTHYDNAQNGYIFSCDAELPDFAVEIASNKFIIPGHYLIYSTIS